MKPCHVGTHMRVVRESYPMNTNVTGFRWFSKIFGSFGRKKPQYRKQLSHCLYIIICKHILTLVPAGSIRSAYKSRSSRLCSFSSDASGAAIDTTTRQANTTTNLISEMSRKPSLVRYLMKRHTQIWGKSVVYVFVLVQSCSFGKYLYWYLTKRLQYNSALSDLKIGVNFLIFQVIYHNMMNI